MVNIIKEKTFGSEFGRAVGTGLGEGASEGFAKAVQLKQDKKKLDQENEEIYKHTNIRLSSTNPELRKIEFAEKLKLQAAEQEKKSDNDYYDRLFGGNNQKPNMQQSSNITPDEDKAERNGFNPLNITDEMILRSGKKGDKLRAIRNDARIQQEKDQKQNKEYEDRVREKQNVKNILRETGDYDEDELERLSETMDPTTARQKIKKQTEPKPYESTADKLAVERTYKYIDDVQAKAKESEVKLRSLQEGMELHKAGATGWKITNALADYFGNEALRDPKSAAFNASMKSQYSGIAQTVGGKVSNFEFQTFQGRIAQAEQSPKTAEALMISAEMENKINIKESEILNRIREEYFEKGEPLPFHNLDIMVQKELRPYADLIMHQTNDKLGNLLNPTSESRRNQYQDILNEDWK